MSNLFLDAFYSLSKRINRAPRQELAEQEEGVVSEKFPELKLDMDNEKLIDLTEKRHKAWIESAVYSKWQTQSSDNENYWLGHHYRTPDIEGKRQTMDPVIFEALETYLPQVTQHNPEPLVSLVTGQQQTPQAMAFATEVKLKLADIADDLRLRLKLKGAARHWAIYLLGAIKFGWDLAEDRPTAKVVRPQRLILDSDATVDEDGYSGQWLGEHRDMEAGTLIKLLEDLDPEEGAIDFIKEQVMGDDGGYDLGTEMSFIEWWTPEYICWTMKKQVLLKKKNPHWNYDKNPQPLINPEESPQTQQNEPQGDKMEGLGTQPEPGGKTQGNENIEPTSESAPQLPTQTGQIPLPQVIKGNNHFKTSKIPYLLLSVYNLGKQPVDDTSLIGQNLSGQDLINKRLKQIDKNADSQNGGMVVAGDRSGLTKSQAKGVTTAIRKGGTVWIPTGPVSEAIVRMSAPPLPADIYQQLQDTRMRLKYVMGVQGFSPMQGGGRSAVRMQLLNRQLDEARISGGFAEYLEQIADDCYNWFLQLLYVYDDKYSQLGTNVPKLKITVKEGSLLPKDSASIVAQAIQLASGGKMATIDLYRKLEYPNPEEMAANAWLEVNAPEILYQGDPRVQQAIQIKQQMAQAGGAKPPSESINYKDLPPEGKAQLAAKAGIQLHPEGIAAHEEHTANRDQSPGNDEGLTQANAQNQNNQP